ncbi:MAG: type II secretion system GspH family protein [Candidatus Peribacteria bacterium]|jgi:prepilin-type N-terminal cleavage/methylation domain-containing protein|nr:type II secretion system GspH family protein [Candidatus Peribacteria bacterium]
MKKSAFTLIEMIIVILVFGTGILAVLYGIVQTLANQDRANTQITSSFLAREGIELMYNLRDSNYSKKLPWNCVFDPIKQNSNESADDVCRDGE